MTAPRPASIRHRVNPRCAPIEKAARLLGLTVAEFETVRPALEARSFPTPVPVINRWDLTAINKWLDDQIDKSANSAKDASNVVKSRLEALRNNGTR